MEQKNTPMKAFMDRFILKRRIEELIINVPDFPKKGIQFKDITPIFTNPEVLKNLISYYGQIITKTTDVNKIVCIDSRGFIFGSLLAQSTGLPFVLARKSGKLPRRTLTVSYELEYGSNSLELHEEDIRKGDNVLIVDDLLATGGTISAVSKLIIQAGGNISGVWNLIELDKLKGREEINKIVKGDIEYYSLIKY